MSVRANFTHNSMYKVHCIYIYMEYIHMHSHRTHLDIPERMNAKWNMRNEGTHILNEPVRNISH